MSEDPIKHAFTKVKEDIEYLHQELSTLRNEIETLAAYFKAYPPAIAQTDRQTDKPTQARAQENSRFTPDEQKIQQIIEQTMQKLEEKFVLVQKGTPAHQETNQTDRQITQTQQETPHSNMREEALKRQNSEFSTGNRGVPADRQTNQQTDRQTNNYEYKSAPEQISAPPSEKFALIEKPQNTITRIEKVAEIINSLDALKRDLRRQFKQLTPQEMLVYSTIYQLTDQAIEVDYPSLSNKTNLTESSIRDYVQKLIKKGVPLVKFKENNKRILLSIPPEFKRMASLDTIISLRNL